MSNATYNALWSEAMVELREQVHLEDPSLIEGGDAAEAHRPTSIVQTFQHLACLYIKYLQIFKRLEICYDGMVHPQKRAGVLKLLELVILRVVELKHALVKYNPPNPAVRRAPGKTEKLFPWEYVNLDDILVDLKLAPDTLEVPVPRYFLEHEITSRRIRDKIVTTYLKKRHGVDGIPVEDWDESEKSKTKMELAQCIEIIQRNERGRQGQQRALLVKELREEEKRRRNYDAAAQLEMDPEIAAVGMQRFFRGFFARVKAAAARDEELVFIGMRPPKKAHNDQDMKKQLKTAYTKRKQEQRDNQSLYEQALQDLKQDLRDEEGPHLRAELRAERTDWVTNFIETKKYIPDDLKGFYEDQKAQAKACDQLNPEQKYDQDAKSSTDQAQAKEASGSKKKKDAKASSKKASSKKGKKQNSCDDDKPLQLPLLQGKSSLTTAMHAEICVYDNDWADRDEEANFSQKHEPELAKRAIRDEVRLEVRQQVDEMLKMSLKKIKLQLEKTTAGGKGGKKKKGKGKKKGGSKKKKGGKSKKKKAAASSKKKKGKSLPGDKLAELKNVSIEEMVAALIESRLVNKYREHRVSDLIGDFNYLGTVQQHTESQQSAWTPPVPSMAQLRAAITEYCILPLGSSQIKSAISPEYDVKSIMLYGPPGAGKTMMAEAVATELGALFINISPARLKGASQFAGKTGPTKLIHMIATLAKDEAFAPVVVYMDQCEQFFGGADTSAHAGPSTQSKKNAKNIDKEGTSPSRFKKDLILYKNALDNNDRIIFIGVTSAPERGELKEYKAFFDKFLHMPYPDYPSRLMIWRTAIKSRLTQASPSIGNFADTTLTSASRDITDNLDLSTLAQISQGFSAGSICYTVKKTLTARRVQRLEKVPASEAEFLNALAQQGAKLGNSDSNGAVYNNFTAKITGLDEERKRVKGESSDANGSGDRATSAKDDKLKKKSASKKKK